MINALNNHRTFLTATAALTAIVGLSACGGATTEQAADAPVAAPAVEAPVTPVADIAPAATETVAAEPTVAEPAVEIVETVELPDTGQLIPASSPELPCTSYVEVTELPVFACSQGQLVTDFQNWAAYVSMDIEVDGYFGQDTYDAVVEFQHRFGLIETGVIDQTLMDALFENLTHPEPSEDEALADDEVVYTDLDAAIDDALTIVNIDECLAWEDTMHLGVDDVSDDQLWACDVLDIRLTSGD